MQDRDLLLQQGVLRAGWARRSCVARVGLFPETPPIEAACRGCGALTAADDLVSTVAFSYLITSRGAEAVRRGHLLGDDDEPVRIADAAVYRRRVSL